MEFLLVWLLVVSGTMIMCTCERTIKLLGILPMTGKGWVGGSSCALPSKLAIEDINANETILNGYNLSYTYIDSQVGFKNTN